HARCAARPTRSDPGRRDAAVAMLGANPRWRELRMRWAGLPLVVLALSVASPAAAVNTQLGVISGFSFSNLNIEGQSGIEGSSSFALGGVVDLGLNERWGIRIQPA